VKAMVWGCRGSLAAPGPDTIASGGNTSCLEIRLADDSLLVLDAGTGIRSLGLALDSRHQRPLHILLTHLHLDHIEGLGFFAPLWLQEQELHLWGPPSPVASLERRIARYLSPPLFPVTLDEMPARIHFHDFPEGEFEIGAATIRAAPVIHRGPTVGLRLTDDSGSLAFIPDHEPYLGFAPGEAIPSWTSGYALAYRVDTLIHDAQYAEDEYPSRRGFGHSSVAHAVAFAQTAEAGKLLLFHHDPLHSDSELEQLEQRACQLWERSDLAPTLAREGMQITISAAAFR
jgi:phosphoribosyl 1,2-cyclic phosphodiesterase